jgi:hypothetical protein
MPYFSNAPGPTPCEDLPLPLSVMEQIKNKSDALGRNNLSKRKPSEEAAGFFFKKNLYQIQFWYILCLKFLSRFEEKIDVLNSNGGISLPNRSKNIFVS